MPFIPHTAEDESSMLKTLGISHIDELFTEIKSDFPIDLTALPLGLSELEVTRLMQQRQPILQPGRCFIGAGAYEHFIPAAVWQIASRGEFYTAYTPYQAEASQGSLQLMYEFQTMISNLMAMEVANASLYDGTTALGEAVLMAVRLQKQSKIHRILVPASIHPNYLAVLKTMITNRKIEFIECPMNVDTGALQLSKLPQHLPDLTAVIIPQPNFFGVLEDVDALTDFAHEQGALVIAVVNPIAMGLLKPPGEWGEKGADIVCGEGQPLGIPLSGGGPYFGFMCARSEYVRQLPGRIVGRTIDKQNRPGFTLTLQAREQHIRRGKATSNICTNQGLMVVAATIYLSLLGPLGLRQVMTASIKKANQLKQLLRELKGVTLLFGGGLLHEFVIRLPKPAAVIISDLSKQGLQAGYDLGITNPELKNCLLVCVTETKTEADLVFYQHMLARALT